MRNLVLTCIFSLLIINVSGAFAVQQAFLVQNSGWMEPFYIDSHSEFKPLINAIIDTVSDQGESVTISSFNQSTPGNESPAIIFSGPTGTKLHEAVNNIKLARKGSGKALADTDFNEAVFKTITGPFKSSPGIIWIFTNNKNSPNNNPETASRNREFYNLVHSEQSITRSLAFPLAMPVKGNVYKANGLMVYALAYGSEADVQLQSIVAGGRLKKVITQQPAQLKPLDKDAVMLTPKSVVNAPNTSASVGNDRRTLILDIDVTSHQPVVKIISSLENRFYPYRIASANISAKIEGKGWANNLIVSPGEIRDLAPGSGSADITAEIPIQVELPKIWSLKSLLDFGRQLRFPAIISIRLENQKLKVDRSFSTRLEEIFPGDPLPDVFVPPESVRESVASIPMLIRVNYPLWPLLAAAGGLGLILLTGIFIYSRSRTVDSYEIIIDGISRRISLGKFESKTITDNSGQLIGTIKRRGGAPVIEEPVTPGHTLVLRQ